MSLVKNEEKKKRKKKHHSEIPKHHRHHKIAPEIQNPPIKKTHSHRKKIKRSIFERYKLQDNWNYLMKKLVRISRVEHLSQIQFYDSSCRQFLNFRLSCFFYKWKYKSYWFNFLRSMRVMRMEQIAQNMRENWPILAAKAKKRISQIQQISAFHSYLEDQKLPNAFYTWKNMYLIKSRSTFNWKNLTKNLIRQENQKTISNEQRKRRFFAKWLYYKSYLIYSYNGWVFSYARRKYDRALILQNMAYRLLHNYYYENLIQGEIFIRKQRKWKEMAVKVLFNYSIAMLKRGKTYLESANKIIQLKQMLVHKYNIAKLQQAKKNLEKERNTEILHEFINKWNEKAKIKTYARKFTKAHLKGVLRDYSRHVHNRAALTIQNWWLGILHRKNSNNLLVQNVFYEWRKISQKMAYTMYKAPDMALILRRPFSISVKPFINIEKNEFSVFRDSIDFAYNKNMILANDVGMEVGDMIDDVLFIPKFTPNKIRPLNNFGLEIEVPSDVSHYDVDFDLWEILYYSTDRMLPPLIDYNNDKQMPINEKLLRIVTKQRMNVKPSLIIPSLSNLIQPIQLIKNTPLEKDIRCRTFDPTNLYSGSFLDSAFSESIFSKSIIKPVDSLETYCFSLIFGFNDRSYDIFDRSFDNAVTSIVRRAFVFKFDITQLDLGYLRNSKDFGFDKAAMTTTFNNAITKAVKENVLQNVQPFERYANIGLETAFAKPRVSFVFHTEYRGLPKVNIGYLKNCISKNTTNAICHIIIDSIFAPDIRIIEEKKPEFKISNDFLQNIGKTFDYTLFNNLQELLAKSVQNIEFVVTNDNITSILTQNDSHQLQNDQMIKQNLTNRDSEQDNTGIFEEEEEEEDNIGKRLLPNPFQKPIFIPRYINKSLVEEEEEEEEEDKNVQITQSSEIDTSREPPDFDFEEDESTEILPTDILDVNPGDIIRSPPQTKSTSTTSTLSFDDETIETTSYSTKSQSIDSSNSSQVITDIILDVRTVIDKIDLSLSASIIEVTQQSVTLPFIQPINTDYTFIIDKNDTQQHKKKAHFKIDESLINKNLSKKPGKIQTIQTITDDSDITYDTMTMDLSGTTISGDFGTTNNTVTFDSDAFNDNLKLPTQALEKRPSIVDDNEPPSQDFVKPPTTVYVTPSPPKKSPLPIPEPLTAPSSPFEQENKQKEEMKTINSQDYTTIEQNSQNTQNNNTSQSFTNNSTTQNDKDSQDQTSFMKDTTEIENLNISNIPAIAPSPHPPIIGSGLIEEEEMIEKILGKDNSTHSNNSTSSIKDETDINPIDNEILNQWTQDFVSSLLPCKTIVKSKEKENSQNLIIDQQFTEEIIGNPFNQWINDFIINKIMPVKLSEKKQSEQNSDQSPNDIQNPYSTPETSDDGFQFEPANLQQAKPKENNNKQQQNRVKSPKRQATKQKTNQSDEPESLDINQFNQFFIDSLFQVTNDAADNLLFRFKQFAKNK